MNTEGCITPLHPLPLRDCCFSFPRKMKRILRRTIVFKPAARSSPSDWARFRIARQRFFLRGWEIKWNKPAVEMKPSSLMWKLKCPFCSFRNARNLKNERNYNFVGRTAPLEGGKEGGRSDGQRLITEMKNSPSLTIFNIFLLFKLDYLNRLYIIYYELK